MRAAIWVWVGLIAISGCAGTSSKPEVERTLHPPKGTPLTVSMLVEEGNKQFAAREWEAAKTQYVAAIKAHPTLAEAHYNLALTLEMMGDQAGAKREYIQAANLAPGHKIIWDSPPLRKHGDIGLETGTTKKDLLEPSKHGPHQ